jgi:membrane associated rhomboid family serine protease
VGRGGSRLAGAPVVKWLLVINAVVFILEHLGLGGSGDLSDSAVWRWGAFNRAEGLAGFELWRLLSFQFLHADLLHLLFNMFALYQFGPIVERWWRSRRFLAFYLLSGVAGAMFYVLLSGVLGVLESGPEVWLVGASAGIFAVLIGTAMIAPDLRVMLMFPPIEMSMRTLALVFVGIATFMIISRGENAGGEAGHLGGVIAGYLLMKFPGVLDRLEGRGRVEIVGRRRPARRGEPKLRPRSRYVPGRETAVDAVLDKINREGFGSLTDEEKEILQRAADEGKFNDQ